MATGIFKIDIDKCTENTLINFIRANTNKGGYNSYQLNENVEDHSYLEKIVYRMAQHDISYMKSDNIDNFPAGSFIKAPLKINVNGEMQGRLIPLAQDNLQLKFEMS